MGDRTDSREYRRQHVAVLRVRPTRLLLQQKPWRSRREASGQHELGKRSLRGRTREFARRRRQRSQRDHAHTATQHLSENGRRTGELVERERPRVSESRQEWHHQDYEPTTSGNRVQNAVQRQHVRYCSIVSLLVQYSVRVCVCVSAAVSTVCMYVCLCSKSKMTLLWHKMEFMLSDYIYVYYMACHNPLEHTVDEQNTICVDVCTQRHIHQ